MVQEPDILHCANLLLRNYGVTDATYRASQRAEACLDQGDADGQKRWLRVMSAIREMAGNEAVSPLPLH